LTLWGAFGGVGVGVCFGVLAAGGVAVLPRCVDV